MTVKQTDAELSAHLADHIAFLEASAAAFDAGHDGEAKRLAVSVRVLVHDTATSRSLLGQLGLKGGLFVDTARNAEATNLATHGGLVYIALGGGRTRYVAMLDDIPLTEFKQTQFDAWWSKVVFVDDARLQTSRKDLILAAVNKDGGAHVDPELDERYAALSRRNSLALVANDGLVERPMGGPERAAIRQIAHEMLKTLKPGYTARPNHPAEIIASTFSLEVGPPGTLGPPVPPSFAKVGRNALCPCGSGRKFKRCHGAIVR